MSTNKEVEGPDGEKELTLVRESIPYGSAGPQPSESPPADSTSGQPPAPSTPNNAQGADETG